MRALTLECLVIPTALALMLMPVSVSAQAKQTQPSSEQPDSPEQPASAEPEPAAVEPVAPAVEDSEQGFAPEAVPPPSPEQQAQTRTRRKIGLGLMIGGGVVSTAGIGLTLAYTVVGDRLQRAPQPVLADVERANTITQVGGVLLASGIVVVAVGGIIFTKYGHTKAKARPMARVRVAPALGGLVVSGRF